MANLKLVEWNMEWMNELFETNEQKPKFRPLDAPLTVSKKKDGTVGKRITDLVGVLNELEPDIVIVIEGPDRQQELQLFFDTSGVNGTWKTQTQHTSGSLQDIGIAVRVDTGKFENEPIIWHDTVKMKEFDDFLVDTDDDAIQENYRFERRPLYVEILPKNGKKLHLMGLHLKSKGIFTAYEWSKWWQIADANRRKILAQATELRLKFLDPFLTKPETKTVPLIVCGDINDGPGLDASEKRLFGSAVERLMGTIWKPHLCLHNVLFDSLKEADKIKLDFSKIETTSFADPIFNNTFQREWIDHILYSDNQINTWVSGSKVETVMKDGQKIWTKYRFASDHYPISAILDL